MPSSQNLTKFKKYIDILANPCEDRNEEEIAKELDISRHTLWDWKHEPNFWDKVWDRFTNFYAQNELPKVNQAVLRKAKQGDMVAAKMIYEIAKRYVEKSQIEVKGETAVDKIIDAYLQMKKNGSDDTGSKKLKE
jgi:hypothetical protein